MRGAVAQKLKEFDFTPPSLVTECQRVVHGLGRSSPDSFPGLEHPPTGGGTSRRNHEPGSYASAPRRLEEAPIRRWHRPCSTGDHPPCPRPPAEQPQVNQRARGIKKPRLMRPSVQKSRTHNL